MKKIINGKVYDTNTAKLIGSWDAETLYQKKTGEFFLFGNRIMPLSYDSAREWAEEHLDVEDYINLFFAESKGDDSKTRLNLYVSTSVAASLKNEAAKRNISIGDFIIILLNEHFS